MTLTARGRLVVNITICVIALVVLGFVGWVETVGFW
jgi:hypothetical protein